jgi:hypothetical protein
MCTHQFHVFFEVLGIQDIYGVPGKKKEKIV